MRFTNKLQAACMAFLIFYVSLSSLLSLHTYNLCISLKSTEGSIKFRNSSFPHVYLLDLESFSIAFGDGKVHLFN